MATIVFVLGAPGAGKGTQCESIVKKYGWKHLSTGDLLRAQVASGSELGKAAEELMASGQMVPTSVIVELLANAMADSDATRFLIDGFPRKLDQLQEFEQQMKPADGVLVFTVPEDVAVERLVARGATSGRADDNEDTIRERMAVFTAESQPVIDYLRDQGANLHEVDAQANPDAVFAAVEPFMDAIDAIAAENEAKLQEEQLQQDAAGAPTEGDAQPAPTGEEGAQEQEQDAAAAAPSAEPTPQLTDALVVFVLGAPGAGKGTQCQLIKERFGWSHVSTGDLLRAELNKGSELGQQVAAIMESGQMVPTPLVLDLLLDAMASTPPPRRFLVDGFPRKLDQLREFEAAIKPADGVLVYTVPEDVAVERLVARGATSGRADDNEDTIRERMAVFTAESQPVIDYLRDQGANVAEIDASGDVEDIFAESAKFLDMFDPPPPGAVDEPAAAQAEESQQGLQPEEEAAQEATPQAGQEEGDALAGYTDEQLAAAVKIQAAGRGYLDRKRVAELKQQQQQQEQEPAALEGEQAGEQAGGQAEEQAQAAAEEQQQEAQQGEADEGLNGYSEEQLAAAMKIQAAGRGYLDRKRVAAMKQGQQRELPPQEQEQQGQQEEQEEQEAPAAEAEAVGTAPAAAAADGLDGYTDEQLAAVTRIQAAHRGYLDRKKVAALRQEQPGQHDQRPASAQALGEQEAQEAAAEQVAAAEEGRPSSAPQKRELTDAEMEAAALRIQAARRGYVDRQKVKAMREQAAASEAKLMAQVDAIKAMLVVCGPSGVGKGTLIGRLMSDHPDSFGFSVSHTTRAPRPGEIHGVHYFFSERAAMEASIAERGFLEYAEVHGNMYGTSLEAVAAVGRSGRIAVLDIDVQGAEKVKASRAASKAHFVFIDPPSTEQLEARLRGRGTETEDKIQLRLANAHSEIEKSQTPGFFDYRVVNDDFDAAYHRLKLVIEQAIPGTFPPAALRPPSAARAPTPPSAPPAAAPAPRVVSASPSPPPPAPLPTQSPPAALPVVSMHSPPAVPAAAAGLPVRQYMDATVVPVLREALRALNESRPEDPLKFVADYIMTARANGGTYPKGGNGRVGL